MATVEDADKDGKLVTELISSPIGKELQTKKEAISKDEFKTPGSKRKARTSPGAPSPGEEEYGEARLEAEVQDTVIIRKRKTRPKKVCRNTEALIDFSEDLSPAESVYDLEDKKNGEGGQEEDTDVMEVDEKSEEVIENLDRKDKGSKSLDCRVKEGVWYIEYLVTKKSMQLPRHLQILPIEDN